LIYYDAEEYANGVTTIDSSDLEIVDDGDDQQVVGLRYVGIDIPPTITITNAYIQFTADEISSEDTSLLIQGEDIDQALAFEETALNVSSRTKTTASVSWNPNPWSTVGESGPDQRTPNIAAIIQEIIERPGWSSGNSLAFIFTGTGRRTTVAYDGDPCGAPLLHIEFTEVENTPPIAVDDGYTTDEDVTLNVVAPGVLVNDTDADGDPLTAILNTDVTSGTLTLNLDGSFQYTPDVDFYGTDYFIYGVNDGTADSNLASVTITVDPVNDGGPVAVNDSYTTDEDVTLNVVAPGVLGNDTDVDGDPLIAILDTGPVSGTLTLNFDGSFQYTPDADFYGTDTFSYVAIGGFVVSNIATVTITVDPVNDAPVAVDDSYTTNKNTSLNVAVPCVLVNDTDTDGDTLTASLETAPGNGSLTLNLDGSFEYIPDAGFTGTDTFTYVANDGTEDSNVATVTINVNYVIFLPLVLK
jgi:VCBS repeat-containing protein